MAEVNGPTEHPTQSPKSTPQAPAPSTPSGWLSRVKANGLLPLQILAIPWVQEIVDQVMFGGRWNLPVHPRSWDGLPGIVLSAFSHADLAHLIGNSIAFTLFSWLILAKSKRDYWINVSSMNRPGAEKS